MGISSPKQPNPGPSGWVRHFWTKLDFFGTETLLRKAFSWMRNFADTILIVIHPSLSMVPREVPFVTVEKRAHSIAFGVRAAGLPRPSDPR